MALASASCKTVSRGSGRSATAAAAYRTAEQITDMRTGEVHDYRRRSGVDHVSMHAPVGAPTMTTAELWNKAEAAENRKNSTVARELVVALPHELDVEQRRELAERIAGQLVERYQVAAQVAVHLPGAEGDKRNHHAHIMFTTRMMDANGDLGAKTRQLDDLKTGPEEVLWMRGMVEAETNSALEQAGSVERIDMRRLAEQEAAAPTEQAEAMAYGPPSAEQRFQLERIAALGRAPTIHEGPRVTAIRRECEQAQRAPLGLCTRMAANDAAAQAAADRAELDQLDAQIYHFEHFAPLQAAAAAARQQEQERQEQGQRVAELRRQLSDAQQALHQAKTTAEVLRGRLNAESPPAVAEAQRLKGKAEQAKAQAQQWREEHPTRAWVADTLDRALEVDRVADEAADRFSTSQELVQARQWQADRRELSVELERLEAQLPTLAQPPRRLEDELLLHVGDEKLRQDIEDSLRVVNGLERSMDAERRDPVRGERMALVERLERSPAGSDLVKVYRDAESLQVKAQRIEAGCTLARKLEVLEATKIALREARSLIDKSPHWAQPELVEAFSAIQEQEKRNQQLRGMDSDRWPDLGALERLQGAASDLRGMSEAKIQAFNERAAGRPQARLQQQPAGPDKPSRGPRQR